MIELYLDGTTRQKLLDYDVENTESCYDRNMYYMTNSESQILYDIIYGSAEGKLDEFGFSNGDIKLIEESDINIKFTDDETFYFKEDGKIINTSEEKMCMINNYENKSFAIKVNTDKAYDTFSFGEKDYSIELYILDFDNGDIERKGFIFNVSHEDIENIAYAIKDKFGIQVDIHWNYITCETL